MALDENFGDYMSIIFNAKLGWIPFYNKFPKPNDKEEKSQRLCDFA